jgi:Lrp/AsnC family leucine-responsive transcriptional regulator
MLAVSTRTLAVLFSESAGSFSQDPLAHVDDTDRRLIALLRGDSRQPLKKLAAALSLSSSSVHERIARLESDGVIRRFTIEIGIPEDHLGAICHLRLRRTPEPAVVEAVTAMREVVRCYALAGEIDLMVELACVNPGTLNSARDRIAALPGVEEVTTHVILTREKSAIDPE